MNQDIVLNLALPVTLFCIMFGMGTNLCWSDFRLLSKSPAALVCGIASQMLLLPVLAYLLLSPLDLPTEIFAGFIILALSPGGTTSNMFSFLAGGNLALSVTLTALVSMVTPFSIPLLASWLLKTQLQAAHIQLPFTTTMLKLIAVTLIPVALGMLLRRAKADFCLRHSHSFTRIPLIMLMLVIAGIIQQNWGNMPSYIELTGLPSILLASVALIVAYFFARSLRQSIANARTIAIETAIQNGGTAILITGSILHNPAMTIPPVMYGILMLIPVSIYTYLSHNLRPLAET